MVLKGRMADGLPEVPLQGIAWHSMASNVVWTVFNIVLISQMLKKYEMHTYIYLTYGIDMAHLLFS